MRSSIKECQYEQTLVHELMAGAPMHFRPTQILEKLLPVDQALNPGNAKIWSILGLDAPPGVLLDGSVVTGDQLRAAEIDGARQLPPFWTSLFLQCKVPDYMKGPRSGQWAYWQRSYYRVRLDPDGDQHVRLREFEDRLGESAVLRYAAPAYSSSFDHFQFQFRGMVLDQSNFVAPSAIDVGHSCWTYDSPGTLGWANPEGEEIGLESWDSVRAEALVRRGPASELAEHIGVLADTVRALLPKPAARRMDEVEKAIHELGIPDEVRQVARDYFTVNATLPWYHVKWVLVGHGQ